MAPPDLRTDEHVLDLGQAGRHAFRREAALGLAVGVADRLTPRLQRRLGPLAPTVATAQAYRRAVPFRVRLDFPDGDRERLEVDDVLQVSVTRRPEVLDVHLVGAAPLREHLAIGRRLRRGEMVQHPAVTRVSTPVVRVVTSPTTDVVLDGEVGTYTPLTLRAQREVSSRSR
jgi:diacylglycerol kinase family enzyme